ncbi:MAG: hypothetical protein GX083_02970 [Clostridiales bacterium]|nr:hypothetical protein [Clostridiales bacterium]
MKKYPALIVNHELLKENMRQVVSWCNEVGIDVAGVIKVTNGMTSVAEDYIESGAKWVASSRIEHLIRVKEAGIDIPKLMIRIPMISELDTLIEVCEYSLQSELRTLKELNIKAREAGKLHKVILMADLGDLREGFIDVDELIAVAEYVDKEMDSVHLAGIGTNLGCYGSVIPTKDKMNQLVTYAKRIEQAIGRKLEIISGGATTSLLPLFDGEMPDGINMLRIGCASFTGPLDDIRTCYGRTEMDALHDDSITLEAEVIEAKIKPTHPIGELGVDAFGQRRKYIDRGNRKRAVMALGRADYGDIGDIIPQLEGAEVIGASGDHTILDIEDCKEHIVVGDIIRFKLKYSAILNLTGSENVKKYEI